MKSVSEIKKITQQALEEKAEQKRLADIEAKKKAEKDHQEMVERAKDVSFFFREIEEAAKDGKNTYSISLGAKDDSEYHQLKVKYIKELLKDFNPQFEDVREQGCEHNWDGDSIDGTEYYYTATTVHFNW